MNEASGGDATLLSLIWNGALSLVLALFGIITALRSRETDAVRKTAESAMQKADEAKHALSRHKVHAAENFATKRQVEQLDQKVDDRFDKIDEKLDDISDRLPRRDSH